MFTSYQDGLNALSNEPSIVSAALIAFALSEFPANRIERRNYYLWVAYPNNYFAFRVQLRLDNTRFSVRGQPGEFQSRPELPLIRGRGGAYTEFVVSRSEQLLAACGYLARAAELYRLGRNRFNIGSSAVA